MDDRTAESFPRRSARTRRFTLGQPRSFSVAGDGSRVAFLRSPAGDDPSNGLWVLDVDRGTERAVVDPDDVLAGEDAGGSAEERARRERAREMAGGVVAYGADPLVRVAAFALGGRLFRADLVEGGVKELAAAGPAFDPRPDPTGERVAYVTDGALHVLDGAGGDVLMAGEEDPAVTWGMAEFVAAEEMGRFRGYWWGPDGKRLVAARVDERSVDRWHIADPSNPGAEPRPVRYPAAGTPNADVRLSVLGLDGSRVDLEWDRQAFPYLVRVVWGPGSPLAVLVQSRDQRRTVLYEADPATGRLIERHRAEDPAWVDIVSGVPAWTDDGRLVLTEDGQDTRRLIVDGDPVTPPGLQVRRVVHAGRHVVFTASEEPTEAHVWTTDGTGPVRMTAEAGVHDAAAGGDVVVITSAVSDRAGTTTEVRRGGEGVVAAITSFADRPPITPRVRLLSAGPREVRTAVLLPSDAEPGRPLPVLLDPYGGPHAQRVLAARDAFLHSQWLADQGFAVVVADGRGTPGRGPRWERSVHLDLAGPVLEDQVEALHVAAEGHPELDLGRVAIRGWSFGGYLAALAVLRRPDVFHAAVAGAPVTDWRLYDTHYTERYLGMPQDQPEAYERSSILADAAKLERPLLIVHGLADDNVLVAHSLRLSQALLEAGRPHVFLPLSGVTHMTPQEVVAENLLLLQVSFLKRSLGVSAT